MNYRTLTLKPPAVFQLQIETLTPMHIGTGKLLRRDYDFAVHNHRTWVINQDTIGEEVHNLGEENEAWKKLLQGRPAVEMLTPQDFRLGDAHFHYSMPGEPATESTGSEMRELMKTPWNEPYLPGSSLKGAMRTAFLWNFSRLTTKESGAKLSIDDFEDKPKIAARKLESAIVATRAGPKRVPNYDIFRALQVSDSSADKEQKMVLVNAKLVTKREAKIPMVVEGIQPGATFAASLTFDRALRDTYGPQELGWQQDSQIRWLTAIRNCVNSWSFQRVQKELLFWKGRSARITEFYNDLLLELSETISNKDKTQKKVCYMQMGWGTGWGSKTLGNLLSDDVKLMDKIVAKYPGAMNPQRTYHPGNEFPSGRRAVMFDDQPIAPLGWLKITLAQK